MSLKDESEKITLLISRLEQMVEASEFYAEKLLEKAGSEGYEPNWRHYYNGAANAYKVMAQSIRFALENETPLILTRRVAERYENL